MSKLSEILKSINQKKDYSLITEENSNEMVPFVVNRCLSYFPDTVLIVNELNQRKDIPPELQYRILLDVVDKRSRFHPWEKKEKSEDIQLIKEFFGYNYKKAEEALELLTDEDLNNIKQSFFKGGIG